MDDPYKIIEGCLTILEGKKDNSAELEIYFSKPKLKKDTNNNNNNEWGVIIEYEKKKFNLETITTNNNVVKGMNKSQVMKYVKRPKVMIESVWFSGKGMYDRDLNNGLKNYATRVIQKQFRKHNEPKKKLRTASKQLKNAGAPKGITNAFNMLTSLKHK